LKDVQLMLEKLSQGQDLDLSVLMDIQRQVIRLQPDTAEVYAAISDEFLRLGEPLIAYDLLSEGLKHWPHDLRLRQLMALALARSGATISANSLLKKLIESDQKDEKTLGLLARTHKDLWSQSLDEQSQQHHLSLAADYYAQAYEHSRNPWAGINAATMALLKGHQDRAEILAQEIRQQCLATFLTSPPLSDQYWTLATLGEAALILGDLTEAHDFYCQAVAIGQGRFGDLSSSFRNASLLLQHRRGDIALLYEWFQIPKVAVFCGHMIDAPERPVPRFPPDLEPRVYRAILNYLEENQVYFGYASAACGSDILFLEALLELNGEIHIVLPYAQDQFLQDSVDIVPTGNWRARFQKVMAHATEVVVASQSRVAGVHQVFHEYSYRILHGLAKARAAQLNTQLMPLTVWNRQPGDGVGGTSSAVNYWRQWSETVEVIDITALLETDTAMSPHSAKLSSPSSQPRRLSSSYAPESFITETQDFNPELRAMLFADVVDFAHLREEQFPAFVKYFLGTVADLVQTSEHAPLFQNTWGDALYFVFPSVRHAGMFALALCDLVQSIDWVGKGLPQKLNLRIALHAGPVVRHRDPITGYKNYIGSHVNHTARIEPITPPGKVYASQAFAALAVSEGVQDFTCDYVGKTPYAKQYGTFPTYHVCRCRSW
jgi:class 3 adenylate cyclase/tetratricopeptide (TPR) repeat protein